MDYRLDPPLSCPPCSGQGQLSGPSLSGLHPPNVVGTCSCCGGRVGVPSVVWVGHTDTTPVCLDCGARGAPPPAHGPVVQMFRPADRR